MRRPRRSTVMVTLGVLLGLAILVTAAAFSTSRDRGRLLDPEGVGDLGGKALVEVLRQQGVEVVIARTAAELRALSAGSQDTTIAVADGGLLGPDYGRQVLVASRSAHRLVVLDGSPAALTALDLPLTSEPTTIRTRRPSTCTGAGVERIARPDEQTITASFGLLAGPGDTTMPPPTLCFPLLGGGSAMAYFPKTSVTPETVVFGMSEAGTNLRLDDADHAAVLLRSLGSAPRLIWYAPAVSDVDPSLAASKGTPLWLTPAIFLLGGAVILLAIARGRRLGALVPEPLPVVVRAAETTRSRGELYRRAGDRPRAAAVLRAASLARLRSRLALGPQTEAAAVIAAASARTQQDPASLTELLCGPDPTTDAELVTLGNRLADLEMRVRTP